MVYLNLICPVSLSHTHPTSLYCCFIPLLGIDLLICAKLIFILLKNALSNHQNKLSISQSHWTRLLIRLINWQVPDKWGHWIPAHLPAPAPWNCARYLEAFRPPRDSPPWSCGPAWRSCSLCGRPICVPPCAHRGAWWHRQEGWCRTWICWCWIRKFCFYSLIVLQISLRVLGRVCVEWEWLK